MKIRIKSFSHFLPGEAIKNQDLIEKYQLKMKAEWIEEYLGIKQRHWVKEEAASDLAVQAIQNLKLKNSLEASLWISTVSPDYFSPSTSSIVKSKLGWKNELSAIDINSACSGLLTAVKLAHDSLSCSGGGDAIVATTETRSKFLDLNDRKTVFLFGDGASALWLTTDEDAPWEINWIKTWTQTTDSYDIFVKSGGSKFPIGSPGSDSRPVISFINGDNITHQASFNMPEFIKLKLSEMNLAIEDFEYFILHPGNRQIYENVLQSLNIPMSKAFTSLDVTGNVGSATTGITLSLADKMNLLPAKGKILVIAMGAGHHLGMMCINRN